MTLEEFLAVRDKYDSYEVVKERHRIFAKDRFQLTHRFYVVLGGNKLVISKQTYYTLKKIQEAT